MKSGVADAIHAAGGELFGMTSEPQCLASEAQEAWEIDFPCVGDPHQEIRDQLAERGLVGVFVNEDYGHLDARAWASHPKGYFQPAVIAMAKEERVLYRWRCRPMYRNMSGAGQRPTPTYTWDQIKARLPEGSAEPALDENPEFARKDLPWPMFLAILLAHGWFIRPKAFPLGRSDDAASAHVGKMPRRIAIFVAAWIAAFALLPTAWVAAALLLWIVIATPGIVAIHKQFQNITTEPTPGPVRVRT